MCAPFVQPSIRLAVSWQRARATHMCVHLATQLLSLSCCEFSVAVRSRSLLHGTARVTVTVTGNVTATTCCCCFFRRGKLKIAHLTTGSSAPQSSGRSLWWRLKRIQPSSLFCQMRQCSGRFYPCRTAPYRPAVEDRHQTLRR